MPQQTKTFRVFISSTFSDMKEERRILQREVFPKLEQHCESKGTKFQAVDLRWGIGEDLALNQKTLETCLNEVARCQRISPKPNFIILLGDKYGWQPAPFKIPSEEMDQIQQKFSIAEKEKVKQWYKLDKNAVPAEYVLQPRINIFIDHDEWSKEETILSGIFRKAVKELSYSQEKRIKYYYSATHQEIVLGALNPPEDVEKPEEHVFVFRREIKNLPEDSSAEGFIDLDGRKKRDLESTEKLKELDGNLRTKLGKNFFSYPARWEGGKCTMEAQERLKFGNDVLESLKKIIDTQLKDLDTTDETEHEIKLHKEFKDKIRKHFRGRSDTIAAIKNNVADSAPKKVFSLIGESGSGKSSVMAEAITQIENEKLPPVYRFIGITSKSSNIISLLSGICDQIAKIYGVTKESLAGEGREKSLYDINGLTEVFRKCLSLATAEKPLVLFLDALDQLSDSDNAKSFYWLSKELPEHCSIVVSAIKDLEGQLTDTKIEHLLPLPEVEAKQILELWLKVANRSLTKVQEDFVITQFNKSEKGLPLYLKLAFEKAKTWHSYDSDFDLHDDVSGIINDFIEQMETEHTEDLVRNVICYMLCGKYEGLTENEILEILAFDKEYWNFFVSTSYHPEELIEMKKELKGSMKIPIAVWSRLYLDLEPYLTERDADGVPIITFFHRFFIKVLREKYHLPEENISA